MIQFIKRHFVPAMLAMMFIFVVLPGFESAQRLVRQYERAIEWSSVKVLTPRVEPGGILYLAYTAKVNKQCPADIRGFLIASDGTVPVRFPNVAGGYAKPSDGEQQIRVSISIPKHSDFGLAPLRSGRYVYRMVATRYCYDGVEEDSSVPDAEFYLDVPADAQK